MKITKIENLGKEVSEILKEYRTEIVEAVDRSASEAADAAAEELRSTSPNRTGKYAKGWIKEKKGGTYIVHQKGSGYRLTHLLEKGHEKRNGGRVKGIPHIEPAEEHAGELFVQKLERRILK